MKPAMTGPTVVVARVAKHAPPALKVAAPKVVPMAVRTTAPTGVNATTDRSVVNAQTVANALIAVRATSARTAKSMP